MEVFIIINDLAAPMPIFLMLVNLYIKKISEKLVLLPYRIALF